MAKARKDNKGRALRRGESQRKSDKRYIYQYKDPNGTRRVIYAVDLLDLREKEKKIVRDQLDGLDTYVSGKATLNTVFDRYMETKYDLKPQTRVTYKYMYDHFVRENFGKRYIGNIKYSDVKLYYYYLINEKGLKPVTIDNIHTLLHPTFRMAVRDGIIRVNPSEGVMAEIKRSNRWESGTRHALTREQQKAFMEYTANSPIYNHWLPLFTVLFGTGCRIGEAVGLRWDDLDYEKRQISINHAVIYRMMENGKAEFHVSTPKTKAGKRTIPKMDAVYQAFDGMSGFVFANQNGGLYNPSMINRAIRRIYEAYNAEEIIKAKKEKRAPILIPHFSCHHMRHTFCTRLCEVEKNIKVAQDIMGHTDVGITLNIYAEANDAAKLQAVNNMQKKFDIF